MSGSQPSLTNLARAAKLLALLLFVLPWVTVSCGEQTLASMSGIDLASGSATVTNPMTGTAERPPGGGQADMFVIAAAILIAASLLATFLLKGRTGAVAAIGGCAAAAVSLCHTVLIRIPAKAQESPALSGAGAEGMSQQQLAELIRIDVAIGFWLTIAALVAAIVLNVMAMRAPAPAPAAPPPPPG